MGIFTSLELAAANSGAPGRSQNAQNFFIFVESFIQGAEKIDPVFCDISR
jgi:hypothetical protein